ncbi:hydroxymethylbilane synthase [Schumannella sp. 10F1B-5-1]|uniref:hydroxymethylbilane synthase n=1 Tax=Schumannella sp. 10F1B-5-1 TaxID=2590780 RepID=UPI0011313E8B|nr:hydroxymethylbilane synthase [Schumannella sp. 10F1B-5-1]TPW78476.1 hydroxymethylbilane synthase [Schumannella sp. 10F1B-5-1]
MTLRIGTRGSALALAQSGQVATRLGDAQLVPIESHGDRSTASLASLGGTGVFATALREALLAGEVDAVVHSLKDLPTAPAEGLEIAAIPKRADARDALIARDGLDLAGLPAGARVGTGSPRRRAQLAMQRGDLELVDIRGNIDTRLARVTGADEEVDAERRLDAIVLAVAGLERLDRLQPVTQLLSLSDWPTAPGQGALAVEVRAGEGSKVAKLDHRPTRLAVEAERAVLARLEAGCAAPIGAHAILEDGLLFLSARVYAPDGTAELTASHAMYPEDARDPSAELGQRVAEELLAHGAADLAPLGGGSGAGSGGAAS